MFSINNLTSNTSSCQDRIEWIDYLKGFTILCVILVHTPGCEWLSANHVNTIFFFVAGMFFKPRPFNEFVIRHTKSLLIPFFIFFLLSYPFRIIVELWDYRSLSSINWDMILDLFKIEGRGDYLYVNVPLWFLLGIFWVQMFYYFIYKLPQWANLLMLLCIYVFQDYIANIQTPFMINNAIGFILYFGLGNLYGNLLANIFNKKRNVLIILLFGLPLVIFPELYKFNSMAETAYYILWCIVLFAAASLLKNISKLKWLKFFGVNTLVILGTHIWILTPLSRIQYMLTRTQNLGYAILLTTLCALFMIPMIIFFNKYLPIATGKRRILDMKNTSENLIAKEEII